MLLICVSCRVMNYESLQDIRTLKKSYADFGVRSALIGGIAPKCTYMWTRLFGGYSDRLFGFNV